MNNTCTCGADLRADSGWGRPVEQYVAICSKCRHGVTAARAVELGVATFADAKRLSLDPIPFVGFFSE
jgi:hypothetical protein